MRESDLRLAEFLIELSLGVKWLAPSYLQKLMARRNGLLVSDLASLTKGRGFEYVKKEYTWRSRRANRD